MKAIIFLGLISLSLCNVQSDCKANPACQECAISWQCDYGQKQKSIDECYDHCLKHAIEYDKHEDVNNAEETTVHKKEEAKAFIQTKKGIENTPEKDRCMTSPACEGCALSWQCEYGQNPELVEECYKHCWINKIGYDIHQAVREAEEVDVHK